MNKNLLLASLFIALFGICVYKGIPAWILFLFFSAYYLWKAFKGRSNEGSMEPVLMGDRIVLGELGEHFVDGPDEDPSYGLYIILAGKEVFVDLREDDLIEARQQYAKLIFNSTDVLESSLARFKASNSKFTNATVASIGLHARDTEQGEVFWDPDGYSILKGLEFR